MASDGLGKWEPVGEECGDPPRAADLTSPLLLSPHLPSAPLVPVYSFGENDIFRVKASAPDSWQRLFQVIIKKLVDISPCIFWGRGLISARSWAWCPSPEPSPLWVSAQLEGRGPLSAVCSQGPSPDLCPLSLQWAAPSRCPSALSPPRNRWTTITCST